MTAAATEATIEERVEAGGRWCDQHYPTWWRVVDPETLDLDDQEACILGQLYGDYFTVDIALEEAIANGFDSEHAFDTVEYEEDVAALTEAWRALIERRRTEAGAAT